MFSIVQKHVPKYLTASAIASGTALIMTKYYTWVFILDVGAGAGIYSNLLKPLGFNNIDCVEVFDNYIKDYSLSSKYKNVIVGDITELDIDFPFLGRSHYLKSKIYINEQLYNKALNELYSAENKLQYDTIALIFTKIQFIEIFGRIKNIKLAEDYYLEALMLSELINYNLGFQRLYRDYGKYYIEKNSILGYELMLKGWNLSKNSTATFKARYSISFLKYLLTIQKYDEFKKIYDQVGGFCDDNCLLGDCSVLHTLYAHYLSIKGDIDSAKYYNEFALNQRIKLGNKSLIGYSYLNLSNNYCSHNPTHQSNVLFPKDKFLSYQMVNLNPF